MLCIVFCCDREGSAELRKELQAVHRKYLDDWNDSICFSGPQQDEAGNSFVGSVFLLNVDTYQQAVDFIQYEPYNAAGVFSSVTIRRLSKGRFNAHLFDTLK
ncbi:YciI family protein [Cupriavidus sp. CV2]|uniref:YciI family protein n=1 Tax=Cupriavidus ulmosensis TaxID=3065913 RepID=UPI00296ADA96|nr:YciI family protein [Cupriavidus sp. CV2]MDW3682797.1 YciI family protein [Cupriavidus sp. CV2]